MNMRLLTSRNLLRQVKSNRYKLTSNRLAVVMRKFGKERAEELKCTYRKVYDVFKLEPFRPFKTLVLEFPSEWEYEGICNEPF